MENPHLKSRGQGTKCSNIALETYLNIELFPIMVCYFRRLTCGSRMQSFLHGNKDQESQPLVLCNPLTASVCLDDLNTIITTGKGAQ